jgi:hypothetical protein
MSDDLPPDLDRLFTEDYAEKQALSEQETDFSVGDIGGMVRCKCGALVKLSAPSRCECGKRYAYWTDISGKVYRLQQMDLGHLNNCVRMLAAKSEKYPGESRAYFEVALDILYEEIGSRDKEIAQLTGIQAALMRSFTK